jgi:hypothetical protein
MIQDYRDDLLSGKRSKGPDYPVLGHIRSGIMRLVRPKKDATDAQKKAYEERVIKYNALVAKGLSWDDIGEKIGGKGYLTPENQDYFTVRAIDCKTNPENAEILHKLYADKEGKIRRLPIVFMSNDWFECIPHQLATWNQSNWLYRSEYIKTRDEETGELGYRRMCVRPVPYVQGKRPFGGRDTTERGPCVPETCEEYQKNLCKLSGYVQGIIPGTRGAGVWQIYTKSIYSFRQMMGKFKLVEKATGRIVGLINEQTRKPIFSVLKVPDAEVSRYVVETGKTVLTEQDLIAIEADIDMFELMLAYQPQAVLARGEGAQRALTGGHGVESATTQTMEVEPENKEVQKPAEEEAKPAEDKKTEHEEFSCPKTYNADDTRCQGCDFPNDCKEQTKLDTETDNSPPAESYQIKVITRGALKFKVEPKAIDEYCATLSYVAAVEAIKMLNEGKFEFITAKAA